MNGATRRFSSLPVRLSETTTYLNFLPFYVPFFTQMSVRLVMGKFTKSRKNTAIKFFHATSAEESYCLIVYFGFFSAQPGISGHLNLFLTVLYDK
jgi:hypothetical protein